MKGQRALASQMEADRVERSRQYNESRTAASTPSYSEAERERGHRAHNAWREAKDYTKPPPGLISMNYADPAQRQRMRERTMNATPTGTAAWGAEGNATALGLAKENMRAHQDEDAASQYESDVRAEDTFQRTGVADSLIAQDWARRSSMLGVDANMQQFATQARIQTQPQSILPALISGGLAAAGMALTGGAAAGGIFAGAAGRQGGHG